MVAAPLAFRQVPGDPAASGGAGFGIAKSN
jgi:hypothetical protein